MSDDVPDEALDVPDIVHWSPRHGRTVGGGAPLRLTGWPLSATGTAVGVLALGALAIGAAAVGALAIGRLSVGQARLRDVKIGRLEIGDLIVVRRNGRPF